jgi:hypothetical protein
MTSMGDHDAGTDGAGRSLLADWRAAVDAIDRALGLAGPDQHEEIGIAERALVRLRDGLTDRRRQVGDSVEAARLQSALERVNTALSLVAGVEYPSAGAERRPLEQARNILNRLGAAGIAALIPGGAAELAGMERREPETEAAGPAPGPTGAQIYQAPGIEQTPVSAPSPQTSQVFHRSTNTLARVSILGGLLLLVAIGVGGARLNTSAFKTNQYVSVAQPVPFSHQHHVAGLGIDCRYCHTAVETSAFAGIPPTETCMTCHSQIWNQAAMLQPVRNSFASGQPIEWNRVHDLPDFVYFNHSIHIAKGIGCSTCHGRVDEMPLMRKVAPLNMEWCLNCHRAPENYIRPIDQVFNMAWTPPANQVEQGRALMAKYHVNTERLTNCSICHH